MNYRIIYSDELYHHGVKGMKWGVRRTPEQLGHKPTRGERKADKYGEKENRYWHKEALARTTRGKNKMGDKRIDYEYKAKQQSAINNATTKKEKFRQKHGAEQIAREYAMDADKAWMRMDRARSERDKKKYDIESFNAQSKSDYFKKMSESNSTLDRIKFAAKNYYKVPLKDTRGRETTVGKELAKKVATKVALDLIMPTPAVKSSGFDVSGFKFQRKAMMKPDGTVDHIDVPVDKKGYADAFARSMNPKTQKDYDYWNDYMIKKLNRYDPDY